MSPEEQLKITLKDAGFSVTSTRKLVFQTLLGKEPQLIGGLVRAVRGSANRSSVYRTLELFEKLGIVHRLQRGFKQLFELTDLFQPHHHHLRCRSCGRLEAVDSNATIETQIVALAARAGFSHSGHTLEIEGLCARCRA